MPGSSQGTVTNSAASPATLTLGANDGSTATFSGTISGALTLTKNGNFTQVLIGANSYSGGTNVSGGTLVAGGANVLSPNSSVYVNTATLDVSAGSQTIPYLGMSSAGTLITSASNTLNVTGPVTLGGTIEVLGAVRRRDSGPDELLILRRHTFATSILPSTNSTLVYAPTELELVTTAPSGPAIWIGGNGSWTAGSNWSNGEHAQQPGCDGHRRHGHVQSGVDHLGRPADRGPAHVLQHHQRHGLFADGGRGRRG